MCTNMLPPVFVAPKLFRVQVAQKRTVGLVVVVVVSEICTEIANETSESARLAPCSTLVARCAANSRSRDELSHPALLTILPFPLAPALSLSLCAPPNPGTRAGLVHKGPRPTPSGDPREPKCLSETRCAPCAPAHWRERQAARLNRGVRDKREGRAGQSRRLQFVHPHTIRFRLCALCYFYTHTYSFSHALSALLAAKKETQICLMCMCVCVFAQSCSP